MSNIITPALATVTFLLPNDDTVHALDVSLTNSRARGINDDDAARGIVATTINARCSRVTFDLGRRLVAADVTLVAVDVDDEIVADVAADGSVTDRVDGEIAADGIVTRPLTHNEATDAYHSTLSLVGEADARRDRAAVLRDRLKWTRTYGHSYVARDAEREFVAEVALLGGVWVWQVRQFGRVLATGSERLLQDGKDACVIWYVDAVAL